MKNVVIDINFFAMMELTQLVTMGMERKKAEVSSTLLL